LPGTPGGEQFSGARPEYRDRLSRSGAAESSAAAPAGAPASALRAEAGRLADSARSAPASPMFPSPQPQVQPIPSPGPVTAGMVDDNADFTS
jgi:hypothetical protein